MEVSAVSMSDLFKQCEDIYTDVVVAAKRARQIIDTRALDLEALEGVDDSDELESLEPIANDEMEKPMVVALDEFLKGKLEWRQTDSEKEK